MKVFNNFDLVKYNNIRLNSIAKEFYIPENYEDLTTLLNLLNDRKDQFYILSGGSDILLKPLIKTPIIYLTELDKTLYYDKETSTGVSGCSVKIQTLINFLADNNLGEIEYLYSLPALVGGCVCMNAGRGRNYNASISDYIISVEYLEDQVLKKVEKNKCGFDYRKSIFQNSGKIITKVFFRFPCQEKEISKKNIKERLEYVRVYQEPKKTSLGSIFSSADKRIMKRIKGLKIGDATYSNKTTNWISNMGNAKYSQVITLINIVKLISFFLNKKAHLEVKKWK